MATKLWRGASGARHLDWAIQIRATAHAHLAHNYTLTPDQRAALERELHAIDGLIARLEPAVTAFAAFNRGAYTESRARQAVADHLCDLAESAAEGALRPHRAEIDRALAGGVSAIFSGVPLSKIRSAGREATVRYAERAAARIRALPATVSGTPALADALDRAAGLLRGFVAEQERDIDPQRVPLRMAVERAIFELREGLEQIDGRLRTDFPQSFIDSLYPRLERKRRSVAAPADAEEALAEEDA